MVAEVLAADVAWVVVAEVLAAVWESALAVGGSSDETVDRRYGVASSPSAADTRTPWVGQSGLRDASAFFI